MLGSALGAEICLLRPACNRVLLPAYTLILSDLPLEYPVSVSSLPVQLDGLPRSPLFCPFVAPTVFRHPSTTARAGWLHHQARL